MADKIISATLKVDTGSAAADIGNVNKSLDQTSKELGGVNQDAKQTTGSFTNLKGALGQIPGPLGAVNQGVNTVNTSLKALAANPIVLVVTLLVAALVALYKAFASTESGAEKIEQIFSGLGAIVTVIRDRILALAGAVISFFKGDFAAAIEQTKAAVTGVGDAIVKAYGAAAQAAKDFQDAEDNLNRNINVHRAELNRDLAKSKELISDTNATYAERKKALEEVSKAQSELAAEEVASAREFERIAKVNLELDKNGKTAKDELAKATIARIEAETQAAQDARNINKQGAQIEADQQQKANEQAQKNHEANQKRLQEQIDREKELDAIRKQRIQLGVPEIVTQQQLEDEALEAKKKREEEEKKIDQERIASQAEVLSKQKSGLLDWSKTTKAAGEAEIKIWTAVKVNKEQVLQTTSNLFGSLANLAGKQTALGKALAIAQTTIDTYQSAISSYKALSGIPYIGPILGAAAAAAAIANGLATVKSIVSVKIPGGHDVGGGSASAPNFVAPDAPIAPQQQGTTIDQSSIAGIGNAAVGRTYVLSQDVTHDQDRNERLNRAARLGG